MDKLTLAHIITLAENPITPITDDTMNRIYPQGDDKSQEYVLLKVLNYIDCSIINDQAALEDAESWMEEGNDDGSIQEEMDNAREDLLRDTYARKMVLDALRFLEAEKVQNNE